MNILLLTTCICNNKNLSDLRRLIESLDKGCLNEINHMILLQNYDEYPGEEIVVSNEKYKIHFLSEKGIISLSKARNILIDEASRLGLVDESDFVSFPDDDCWYPAGFWSTFNELESKEKFQMFYTDFSSKPEEFVPINNKHSTNSLIRTASSNTSIYCSDVFKNIGLFDEEFGVGAKNNGGEDLDYAIRAMLISSRCYFHESKIIGHRDPLPEYRYKYYKGSFGVLGKHRFKSFALMLNYIRKLLVGVVFLFGGKIKFSDFRLAR